MAKYDSMLSSCIVCNSASIRPHLVDHNQNTIYACDECDFQFMNPQYTNEYLDEYYSSYTDINDSYWDESAVYGHDFYLSLVERFVKPGKLLDVGCGNGYLLTAALKRGWSATGYDVDAQSTQGLSARLGIDVLSGDLFSAELGSDYDLITLHQVIEHLKDPVRYLEKIRDLLNNPGYIFVAVPNIKSLSNRYKRLLEMTGLKKENIGKYYDSSHHLLYFQPGTMRKLLEANGFEVIYTRNCHSSRPGQSKLKRFIMRNLTDHLFPKSAFLMIARKQKS